MKKVLGFFVSGFFLVLMKGYFTNRASGDIESTSGELIPIAIIGFIGFWLIFSDTKKSNLKRNKISSKNLKNNESSTSKESIEYSKLNHKSELLEESFELGVISEKEFNQKTNKLENKRKILESNLEIIKEKKKKKQLDLESNKKIKNQIEKLKELRKELLLTETEFNEKVKKLKAQLIKIDADDGIPFRFKSFYYMDKNLKEFGPFSANTLNEYYQNGKISTSFKVRNSKDSKYTKYCISDLINEFRNN